MIRYTYFYPNNLELLSIIKPREYGGNERQWRAVLVELARVLNVPRLYAHYDQVATAYDDGMYVYWVKKCYAAFNEAVEDYLIWAVRDCFSTEEDVKEFCAPMDNIQKYKLIIEALLIDAQRNIKDRSFHYNDWSGRIDYSQRSVFVAEGLDYRTDVMSIVAHSAKQVFANQGMRKLK